VGCGAPIFGYMGRQRLVPARAETSSSPAQETEPYHYQIIIPSPKKNQIIIPLQISNLSNQI